MKKIFLTAVIPLWLIADIHLTHKGYHIEKPLSKSTTMNKKFMEIQKSSNFIYDVIKTNTLKR